MYVVQIHSLKVHIAQKQRTRTVYLEVSSESHPSRRYNLGLFGGSGPLTRTFESITHLTTAPVTLRLSIGPRRYHYLGAHTLLDFLYTASTQQQNNANSEGDDRYKGRLVYGRGEAVTYYLKYTISPVYYTYRFALNEINCLQTTTRFHLKDHLYAEVEFNHSPHEIDPGPRNRYDLGGYSSLDTGPIHTTHNLNFSAVTNFKIHFYIQKTAFSGHDLGTLRFIPINEVFKDKYSLGLDSSPPTSQNDENQKENKSENSRKSPPQGGMVFLRDGLMPTPRNNSNHSDNSTNNQSDNDNNNGTESDNHELLLLPHLPPNIVTKKIILSSAEKGGSSYEFVFTLSREANFLNRDDHRDNINNIMMMSSPPSSPTNSIITHSDSGKLTPVTGQRQILDILSEKDMPWVIVSGTNNEKKQKELGSRPSGEGTEEIINNKKLKGEPTVGNDIEVLIDGSETFQRYFEIMMEAQHSIKILAWELSLSFGLVKTKSAINSIPSVSDPSAKWITLEDVLLDRALQGVNIRIIVWRHAVINYLERFLYMGEASIEYEVNRLEKRCNKLGVTIKVFRFISDRMPDVSSPYASPFPTSSDADITVVIVGSPKGLYLASHHEKLLLIDAECPDHSVAFVGGFDIARGRYDHPSHPVPKPTLPVMPSGTNNPHDAVPLYNDRDVQSMFPSVRLLWHDIQFLMRGPATQSLHLHFVQRWIHAFTRNAPKTRRQVVKVPLPMNRKPCGKHPAVSARDQTHNKMFKDCGVRVLRIWKGVFDTQYLFREFTEMIMNAKHFLYLEHQYPFHNYPLTHFMCQALQKNPDLLLLIVTPVKTDLLTGFVGNLVDWSQDHIIQHLQTIKKAAPDRVGIYGIVQQDESSPRIKPIYVHSKMAIIDDEWMLTGSTNMDNMSFFYSSELSFTISSAELAIETKQRLLHEHLGKYYKPEMEKGNFQMVFDAFKSVATMNDKCLRAGLQLVGRPVFIVPAENYEQVLKRIYYPTKVSKLLYKMGINTEDLIQNVAESGRQITKTISQLPFIRSQL